MVSPRGALRLQHMGMFAPLSRQCRQRDPEHACLFVEDVVVGTVGTAVVAVTVVVDGRPMVAAGQQLIVDWC